MTSPDSGFESAGIPFEDYSGVVPAIEPEGLNRRRRNALAVIGGTVAVILGLSILVPAKADADGGGFNFDMYGNNPGWSSHRINGAAILSQPRCGEELVVDGKVIKNPVSFMITGKNMEIDRPLAVVVTAASYGYDGRKDSVIAVYGQDSKNISANFNGYAIGVDGQALPLSADDVLDISVYEANERSDSGEKIDLGERVLSSTIKYTCS